MLLWIAAAGWAVFAVWRLFGPDRPWAAVVALAYTPYVLAASLAPIIVALLLRAGRALTLLLLTAMALVAVVAPRGIATTPPSVDGPELVVMTANLRVGGGDVATLEELIRENGVDVLSVQEVTAEGLEALRRHVAPLLPYEVVQVGQAAGGTGIYSRFPLTEREPVDGMFHMPRATLEVPGAAPVDFTAVHPASPHAPERMVEWRRDLAALPSADRNGAVRILAGDFNATLDHRSLRDLIDTGYTDAADATGTGLIGTWRPVGGVKGLAPPVALDRVLVDERVAVRDVSVHAVEDSDHRAVVVVLGLPGAE
ncbi:endonuclease/exonuclease/phosphatase family protein [Stackebrandtia albiflava]